MDLWMKRGDCGDLGESFPCVNGDEGNGDDPFTKDVEIGLSYT